jgi:hypothetical protein
MNTMPDYMPILVHKDDYLLHAKLVRDRESKAATASSTPEPSSAAPLVPPFVQDGFTPEIVREMHSTLRYKMPRAILDFTTRERTRRFGVDYICHHTGLEPNQARAQLGHFSQYLKNNFKMSRWPFAVTIDEEGKTFYSAKPFIPDAWAAAKKETAEREKAEQVDAGHDELKFGEKS